MAKKKNISKKHKFKHVESAAVAQPSSESVSGSSDGVVRPAPVRAAAGVAATQVTSDGRDFSYVTGDLKRIGILGGSLIALELVLYYVLVHTAVGTHIYSLVRV